MPLVRKIFIYGELWKSKNILFHPPKRYLKIKKWQKKCSITNSGRLRIVHTNFYPNPKKLIFNLDFYSKKIQLFFSTLKIILKIKNSKKGLCSHDPASIYYKHAKGQVPTMIGFQSGRGGHIIEGGVSYYGQTCIYIYIYIYIYI